MSETMTAEYHQATEAEKNTHNVSEDYDLLVGPGGFWCFLGEPEDRTWDRDASRAVAELNRLHSRVAELEAFSPTVEQINRLPEGLRNYVHGLETRCDPAGDVAALTLTRDQNMMLSHRVAELEARLALADGLAEAAEKLKIYATSYRSHHLRNPDDKLEQTIGVYDQARDAYRAGRKVTK